MYVENTKICPKCGGVMYVGRIYPGESKTPIEFADVPQKDGDLPLHLARRKRLLPMRVRNGVG